MEKGPSPPPLKRPQFYVDSYKMLKSVGVVEGYAHYPMPCDELHL